MCNLGEVFEKRIQNESKLGKASKPALDILEYLPGFLQDVSGFLVEMSRHPTRILQDHGGYPGARSAKKLEFSHCGADHSLLVP